MCMTLGLILASSCISNSMLTNEVTVNKFTDVIDISSLADSIHVIKPSSHETNSIISRVDRVLSMNDRIYIVDRASNKLFCFDHNGNFISSTKSIIGHGKMEYTRLMDATVDPSNSTVYLFCDATYKIIKLDADLNALESFSFDDLFYEIAITGDYLYALCKNKDSYELRQYNTKDMNGKYNILLKNTEIIHGVFSIGKSMNSDGSVCHIALPFSNKLHRINNNIIENETTIDFESYWFDYDKNKKLAGSKFIDATSDKMWIIMNHVVTDSITLFNTNETGIVSISANGQASINREVINKDFPFTSTLIYPLGGVNGAAVTVAENDHITRYKKICKENNIDLSDDSNPINKGVRDYTPTDNPILVIEYLKGRSESKK